MPAHEMRRRTRPLRPAARSGRVLRSSLRRQEPKAAQEVAYVLLSDPDTEENLLLFVTVPEQRSKRHPPRQ